MMSPIFNESRRRASRGERKAAYAVAAFVSEGPSRPQNHPVAPQGEKNPNNRQSKSIASKLRRPFNCALKHKAYCFPGRIFPLFFFLSISPVFVRFLLLLCKIEIRGCTEHR